MKFPSPFLELRYQDLSLDTPTSGLCAGYEGEKWRAVGLAKHLVNWLPYIALSQDKGKDFGPHNFMELMEQAAYHVYTSKKTKSRGEIGEILTHIACVQYFDALPVICKLTLKTSPNDTVKGFDGVFLVPDADDFEIWLCESKFYQSASSGIKDAVKSIKDHLETAFLRAEKAVIIGHLSEHVEDNPSLVKLFSPSTSVDDLLARAVFPVVLSYESGAINSFEKVCDDFKSALEAELLGIQKLLVDELGSLSIRVHLIGIPLGMKAKLIERFDQHLEAYTDG